MKTMRLTTMVTARLTAEVAPVDAASITLVLVSLKRQGQRFEGHTLSILSCADEDHLSHVRFDVLFIFDLRGLRFRPEDLADSQGCWSGHDRCCQHVCCIHLEREGGRFTPVPGKGADIHLNH